jgi:hypothetical protein
MLPNYLFINSIFKMMNSISATSGFRSSSFLKTNQKSPVFPVYNLRNRANYRLFSFMYDGLESDPDRIQNIIFYSADIHLLWILQYHRAAVRVNIYFASADMRKKRAAAAILLTAAALKARFKALSPF